ncbi:MAG: 1-(5-phosphoribosyl)-5-[(5-phosphoribosylamino)methylideneamino]imidazole-4-carboxamide isomerase [Nitrospira sp.]|nr:1-(5-phosphoribosyl)-5-[(5-phosphoribosylamino)methylideneamino]imidazole-4-carboxamide isomerase [Candidatus Manganitrophaceae bacterium]HIL34677.1 1-(5-phosphoribosyl)-5-[(5-phosphoribosylamino)methylideneamino]imidazole-4-carboxamide isomerase [Candidatus Manganitrophaceae bacterium]
MIIPAIDLKGGRCVRLTQGEMNSETVYAEDPVAMAQDWEAQGAARLHLVDLDGAVAGQAVHAPEIGRIIESITIPVQIGGGIRSLSQIEKYLSMGAAAVILGTAALQNRPLVREACLKFPGKILAGIDSKEGKVAIRGWKELCSETPTHLAVEMQDAGVASIILTDIERDGMLSGPNLDLLQEVAQQVDIPLIASGGITTLEQIAALSRLKGVGGMIVGKALYVGRFTLQEALALLRKGT